MTMKTILTISDSGEELKSVIAGLRAKGYRLTIAPCKRDALGRASTLSPDLILLDARSPLANALALCRLIKADETTTNIPILILSESDRDMDRIEFLRAGAADYMHKPAHTEEVLLRTEIHWRHQAPLHRKRTFLHRWHPDAPVLTVACEILEMDLATPPQLDDLASMVGTNRHRLTRIFREIFGCTVFNWVRERRMQVACTHLTHTSLSIRAIADELGFVNSCNFSTAFRERFGTTPSQYRRHGCEIDRKRPCTVHFGHPAVDLSTNS